MIQSNKRFMMGSNPINLMLRFILELISLISIGFWGWSQFTGLSKIVLTIILPVTIALLWGVFAVPDDPSRSGKTVVATPGYLRLILEIFIFSICMFALYKTGRVEMSYVISGLILIHYVISYDRIIWLFKN